MKDEKEIINDLEHKVLALKAEIKQLKNSNSAESNWSQRIIDSIPNPVFMKNSKREFVLCNIAFADMFGLSAKDLFGKKDEDFSPADEAAIFRQKDEEVLENGIVNWNQENHTMRGVTRTILTSKTRVEDDNGNYYVLGSIADITDNKNQHTILLNKKNEIEEQKKHIQTLLKEVHHRVKNNLQIVNSLLNLQMGKIEEPDVSAIIKNAQNRIFSMAKIHEILCESESLSSINLKVYIDSLTRNIRSSFNSSKATVIKLNVPNLLVGAEIAIPVGLIVNEIVTNSIKYGSVKHGDLEIYINFKKHKNELYSLQIGDNGDEANQSNFTPSLGSELIAVFAEQLEAKYSIPQKENGVHYSFTFN